MESNETSGAPFSATKKYAEMKKAPAGTTRNGSTGRIRERETDITQFQNHA